MMRRNGSRDFYRVLRFDLRETNVPTEELANYAHLEV